MRAEAENKVVRTFWHGSDLGIYEELALASFVKHGHTVQIFSYHNLRAIAGVELVHAGAILPEAEVNLYKHGPGGIASFSDVFRYKLLHELGGTWVDADVLCLKPFWTLPLACVAWQDDALINNAIMRFPPGHSLAAEMYERAKRMGHNTGWGQTGPCLLTEVVQQNGRQVAIMPRETFYPIRWPEAWRLISAKEGKECEAAAAKSYGVHWWNEVLRRIGLPKNKLPPVGSYIHRRACEILGENRLQTWSADEVEAWIANYVNPQRPPRSISGVLVDFVRRPAGRVWRRAARIGHRWLGLSRASSPTDQKPQ